MSSNTNGTPSYHRRKLGSLEDLGEVMSLMNLREVQFPNNVHERDSLFVSLGFWKARYEINRTAQCDSTVQNISENLCSSRSIQKIRHQLHADARQYGRTDHIVLWSIDEQVSTFVLDEAAMKCVYESNASDRIAILSCTNQFLYRPILIEAKVPVTSCNIISRAIIRHLRATLEECNQSEVSHAQDLRIALGGGIKDLIDRCKELELEGPTDEQGTSVLFYGSQGVGKSHLINQVLKRDLAPLTDTIYGQIVTWYWLSFQQFQEETVLQAIDEDELDIYHPHSNFQEIGLDDPSLDDFFLFPEGSILSTTHLNARVYYGPLFAITIEFFSKQEVQTEFDIAKHYQSCKSRLAADKVFVAPRALNMIGVKAPPGKLPKSYLHIDPYFQCKLGKTIKYTSPYTTVDASLRFLKAKLLSYGKSDRYVWGLIKSLHIELPSRMLRGGGCLIDSPGFVHNEFWLQKQTDAAIASAASVVYVSQTGDFQNELALLLDSPFAQNYLPKIGKNYKDNALQTMPAQWIFAFPSDKSLQNKNRASLLKAIAQHLQSATDKLEQKFFAEYSVDFNVQLDEAEEGSFVRSLFQCYLATDHKFNFEVPQLINLSVNPTVKIQLPLKSGIAKIIRAANNLDLAPEIYQGPIALTHVHFHSDLLHKDENGVDLFMNSLTHALQGNRQATVNRLNEIHQLFAHIDECLCYMSDISKLTSSADVETKTKVFKMSLQGKNYIEVFLTDLEQWQASLMFDIHYLIQDTLNASSRMCTYEYLASVIASLPRIFKSSGPREKVLQFINSACVAGGNFQKYSLSNMILAPMWKSVNNMLEEIGKMITADANEEIIVIGFNNTSIINEIDELAQKIFQSEDTNETLDRIIRHEKNRFTVEMKASVLIFKKLQQILALEKTQLQKKFSSMWTALITQRDKELAGKKRVNNLPLKVVRENYLKELLPAFVEECTQQTIKTLSERIASLLGKMATKDSVDQQYLGKQMNAFMEVLSTRYSAPSLIQSGYDVTKMRQYFQALHFSILDNILDANFYSQKLEKLLLTEYSRLQISNASELRATVKSLEWNKLLEGPKGSFTSRWGFEEKKAVVNQLKDQATNISSQSIYLPLAAVPETVRLLQQKFPLANLGKARSEASIENMLFKQFRQFGTAQLALNFVNNDLNRTMALRTAFSMDNEPDTSDLDIRRAILIHLDNEDLSDKLKDEHLFSLTERVNEQLDLDGFVDVLKPKNVQQFIQAMSLESTSRTLALEAVQSLIAERDARRDKKKAEKQKEDDDMTADEEVEVRPQKPVKKRKTKKKTRKEPLIVEEDIEPTQQPKQKRKRESKPVAPNKKAKK